ncbi:hypothetical protein BKA62DRAFT_704230 [Auriculariales sp. MPI-PUGE-AT-0066]|nr:hypothetical protein BKA62DRAFT_704230 [Auriculariales sp. MPI-PUGE-AT-0066]
MTSLVARWLELPHDARVICVSFIAPAAPSSGVLEAACQLVSRQSRAVEPVHALLPIVAHDELSVFAIASKDRSSEALAALTIPGLILKQTTSLEFEQLYSSKHADDTRFLTPAYRDLYLRFLSALRQRLLYDICNAPTSANTFCLKLRDGFILVPYGTQSEWAEAWDSKSRRLVHCCVHLQWFSPSKILVRPSFTSTPFSSLRPPLASSGAPILLLPYGIPAFLLGSYAGPADQVLDTFSTAFDGHCPGISDKLRERGLLACWVSIKSQNLPNNSASHQPGDDRAAVVVWPAMLVLAVTSLPSATKRPALPDTFGHLIESHKPTSTATATLGPQLMQSIVRTTADLPQLADAVTYLVDAVSREREREREERVKEERFRRPVPTRATPQLLSSRESSVPADRSDGSVTHTNDPASQSVAEQSGPVNDSGREATGAGGTFDVDMSMGMDLDMGMSMDVDISAFGLTDDDFSFWDGPKPAPGAVTIQESSMLVDSVTNPSPLFDGADDFTMTVDESSAVHQPGSTPHTPPGASRELFGPGTGWTPQYASPQPLSPAKTPIQQPVLPPTSELAFAMEPKTPARSSRRHHDPFDPIPFASSHDAADAKYALAGKFAAYPLSPQSSSSEEPSLGDGHLVRRYNHATDPSVGLVRRLRALRNPAPPYPKSSTASIASIEANPRTPRWLRTDDAWIDEAFERAGALPSPPSSDDSSDDEILKESTGELIADDRPLFPALSSLLTGSVSELAREQTVALHRPPDLQANQQQPLGAPTPVSPAPVGSGEVEDIEPLLAVLAKEAACNPLWARACKVVVRERSQDFITLGGLEGHKQLGRDDLLRGAVCLEQLGYLAQGAELQFQPPSDENAAAVEMGSALPWTARRLVEPQVGLAKNGAVVQLGLSALRFWERFGLGPRGGPKQVTAFIIFEETRNGISSPLAASWLDNVGCAYKTLGLGSHTSDTSVTGSQPGLVPLKWEHFRRAFSSILSASTPPSGEATSMPPHIVVYVVVPMHFLTMSTGTLPLRTIFGVASGKFALHNGAVLDPDRVLVHLIPEPVLLDSTRYPVASIARTVYDRLPLVVARGAARPFFRRGLCWRSRFDAPAVALARKARDVRAEVKYEWPVRHLDVLDRHTFLHVAYALSSCGTWVLFCAIDERGESSVTQSWAWTAHWDDETEAEPSSTDPEEQRNRTLTPYQLTRQVWKNAMDVAGQADVEWRLVITKYGVMARDEVLAWKQLMQTLRNSGSPEPSSPHRHVSVTSIHIDHSLPVITPELKLQPVLKPGGGHTPTTMDERPTEASVIQDLTWRSAIILPPSDRGLAVAPRTTLWSAADGEWAFSDGKAASPGDHDVDGVLQLPMAAAVLVADDEVGRAPLVQLWDVFDGMSQVDGTAQQQLWEIASNMRELAILDSVRAFREPDTAGLLPAHVAAVERMQTAVGTLEAVTGA